MKRQIEAIEAEPGPGHTWRLRSPAYTYGGYASVAAVAGFVLLFLFVPPPDATQADVFQVSVLQLLFGIFLWLLASCAWLEFDDDGVRVVNPINEAYVPFAELKQAWVDGTSLRLTTEGWRVGVFAVEMRNIERRDTSRSARLAAILQQRADAARKTLPVGGPPKATKRWRLRRRYWVTAIVGVAAEFTYFIVLGAPLWQ